MIDYPAFFGDAPVFWNKTLHEGRMLNYIWHCARLDAAWFELCRCIRAYGRARAALAVSHNRAGRVAVVHGRSGPAHVGLPVEMLISPLVQTR